jgi:hypothetical protein
MILKSPPTNKGTFSVSHIRISSLRKASLSFSCAAPYRANYHHSKLSSLLRSLNFNKKLPCLISNTSIFSLLTPTKIPPDLPFGGVQSHKKHYSHKNMTAQIK